MSRKFLFLVISVLLAIGGFIWIRQTESVAEIRQAEALTTLPSSQYRLFSIPKVPTSKKSYQQIITSLNRAAQHTQTTYLKRQVDYGWNQVHQQIHYDQSTTKVYLQVSSTKEIKRFSKIDGYNPAKSGLIATIKPLGFTSRVMPIQDSLRGQHREGDYYLNSRQPGKYEEFLTLGAKYLSQATGKHYQARDFHPGKEYETTSVNFDEPDLSTYQSTTVIFLLLFTVILILGSSQRIAIYRLNGYTTQKIFNHIYGKVVLFSLALVVVDLLIIHGLGWSVVPQDLIGVLALMVTDFGVAWLTILLLKYSSSSHQMKRMNYNRLTFLGLYLVKAFFIIYMFVGFIPVLQVATGSYDVLASQHRTKRPGDYYGVFYPYANGNNSTNGITQDFINQLDETMYPVVNRQGSLLMDDSYIHQDIANYYKYLIVNPNYLKRYPILDTARQKISVPNKTNKIWLLIPTNKQGEVRQLIRGIQDGERENLGYRPPVKVVYFSSTQKITDLMTPSRITDWPLLVTTPDSTSAVDRNIMNGEGLQDDLRVPVKGGLAKTYRSYRPSLLRYNYGDNYPQLIYAKDIPMEDLRIDVGSLKQSALELTLSLLVTFFLTGYITLIYFRTNQEKLIIKRINGYSLLKTYRPLVLMILLQMAIMAGITIVNHGFNGDYWVLNGLVTLAEFLIWLSMAHRLEREKTKELLNDN